MTYSWTDPPVYHAVGHPPPVYPAVGQTPLSTPCSWTDPPEYTIQFDRPHSIPCSWTDPPPTVHRTVCFELLRVKYHGPCCWCCCCCCCRCCCCYFVAVVRPSLSAKMSMTLVSRNVCVFTINAEKTNEMMISFSNKPVAPPPVTINNTVIEHTETFKLLWVRGGCLTSSSGPDHCECLHTKGYSACTS